MAAPTITGVTPGPLYTGDVATITGTNFTGATDVEMYVPEVTLGTDHLNAVSYTVVSATKITAVVPHWWTPVILQGGTTSFARWRVTTLDGTATSGRWYYAGPVIQSLTLTPNPASVPADGSVQLTATAHYLHGSDFDATKEVSLWWSSADESVATVASGLWNGGLTFGREPGSTTISATMPDRTNADSLVTGVTTLNVTAPPPPPPPPEGRFSLAFDSPSLEPYATWTCLDIDHPNLVTSYTIDRGRSYELDRTDTGRATVQIADSGGILDPTNPSGPYYGKIKPRIQAAICRYDPVSEEWSWRYRGFVEDFSYDFDPSQQVNRLTISLIDLFEVLAAAEMQPGVFGVAPPVESTGQIYFPADQSVETRIASILTSVGLARPYRVLLAGTVTLHSVVYSPGESALTPIQEAADAEFPGVSNVFCDRSGRITFHGREAKFDPAGTAATWGPDAWDYHEWKAGDAAAVATDTSGTVQLREFGSQRGLAKMINSASATPAGIDDDHVATQLVVDAASISEFGARSWSASGLLTKSSLIDDSDDLVETKRFATYYVANYAQPRDRINAIGFRVLHPTDPRAEPLWQFLNTVDIGDSVEVTVASPGGGGFSSAEYFVEGIHEDVRPLTPGYDDVTLRLDLSPRAYFVTNPWP